MSLDFFLRKQEVEPKHIIQFEQIQIRWQAKQQIIVDNDCVKMAKNISKVRCKIVRVSTTT